MFVAYNYFRQHNENQEILDYKSFYRDFSNSREFGGQFVHEDHLVKNRFMNIYGHMVNIFLRKQPKKVLDIGCGAGINLPLSRVFPNVEYYGVDFAEKSIDAAMELFPDVQFQVMDAFDLKFDKASFDMAILSSVLILYKNEEDRFKLIEQAYKILKPNGLLVCIIWKESFFLINAIRISRIIAKLRKINLPKDFHGVFFSTSDALAMFTKSRFKIEERFHTASLYGVLESVRHLNMSKYRRNFGKVEKESGIEHPQNILEDLVHMSNSPLLTKILFSIERHFPDLFSMFSIYVLRK